jgi:hypothetical protein
MAVIENRVYIREEIDEPLSLVSILEELFPGWPKQQGAFLC